MLSNLSYWILNFESWRRRSRPDEVIKALNIKSGDKVMDLGSGGGYFALRIASAFNNQGAVYAADTDAEALEYVGRQAARRGLSALKTIKVSESAPLDCPEKLDLIFCRSTYHHLPENRVAYLRSIKNLLSSGGRIAVIDYHPKGFIYKTLKHSSRVEDVKRDFTDAGYELLAQHFFLRRQLFLIFTPKSP